jgi:tripartite-type tricarboxylate transporter receptor subunit TctC
LLKRETGVNVTHVPYRGTGAALADLLGGQIDAMFADVAVVMPNVQAKMIVPLAVTSAQRSAAIPDVRTMEESGYPQLRIEGWGGLLAPSGLTPEVLARLNAAVQKALVDSKFREGAAKQGWSLDLETSPEKFAKFLQDESARWGQLIKAAQIKID